MLDELLSDDMDLFDREYEEYEDITPCDLKKLYNYYFHCKPVNRKKAPRSFVALCALTELIVLQKSSFFATEVESTCDEFVKHIQTSNKLKPEEERCLTKIRFLIHSYCQAPVGVN